MTLIDRYLHSVRGFLPPSRQADIIKELTEDLGSQVADREDDLGRPLTEAEQEELLKRYGHPMVLASRYGPQRSLIGPALLPFYWAALKISLGIGLVVQFGLAVASVANGAPVEAGLARLVTYPFTQAIYVFGWVTLGFAFVDFAMGEVRLRSWNPGSLPIPGARPPRARGTMIAEVVAGTLFFFWWLAIPQYPFLVLGPAAAVFDLAPAWDAIYTPASVFWALSLAALWMMILQPDWLRFRRLARTVANLGGIVFAAILMRADALIVLRHPGAIEGGTLQAIEVGARLGLMIFIIASAVEVVKAALFTRDR